MITYSQRPPVFTNIICDSHRAALTNQDLFVFVIRLPHCYPKLTLLHTNTHTHTPTHTNRRTSTQYLFPVRYSDELYRRRNHNLCDSLSQCIFIPCQHTHTHSPAHSPTHTHTHSDPNSENYQTPTFCCRITINQQ